MYRTYENPYEVEKALATAIGNYNYLMGIGADTETLYEAFCDVNDLTERVITAWMDYEEADD